MAEKFLMPKLSPTMEEGQISRWVKNEGEKFDANETLAEVDTDKATMEMTALSGGTLLKILKQAGDTAALGEPIAIVGNAGEDISALLNEVTANGAKQPPASADGTGTATESAESKEQPAPSTTVEKPEELQLEKTSAATVPPAVPRVEPSGTAGQRDNGRMLVSPIAARMAADNGIDLRSLAGSGPSGRIIKRDIEAAMAAPKRAAAPSFNAATVAGASPYRDEPTSQMRRVIA
ncbi:MAG TPA: biotin/lipoyl-containing protein, partial [Pyrinomonadaceae bacterium]|nr:biotin/lipoyl-containing protein [Pyrinomonadaceae bacterium]